MIDRVKTILLVTIVTAIVWLFAESESVRSKDVALTVEIVADPGGGTILQAVEGQGWRERVQVTVTGSAGAIASFEAGAAKGLKLSPTNPGMPTEAGEAALDLKQVFRETSLFTERGVSIARVEPASVRVWVDRVVSRTVPLLALANFAEVEGAASATPATVKITGPESILKRLSDDAQATVQLDREAIAKLVPGRKEVVKGVAVNPPVELAGAAFVTITPSRADVELVVKTQSTTHVLANVPVQVLMPPLVAANWQITTEQVFFADVQATGSAELIERLKRGEVRVFAVLVLSADELERNLESKEATLQAFPQSGLSFKVDAPLLVRFKALKRETPPAKSAP